MGRRVVWQHRITRAVVRQRDLFGRCRWTVIRTSNAYIFRDPKSQLAGAPAAKSENRSGTQDQEILDPVATSARDPATSLERALARFGAAVAAKQSLEQEAAG